MQLQLILTKTITQSSRQTLAIRLWHQTGRRIVNPKLYRIVKKAEPVVLFASKHYPATSAKHWLSLSGLISLPERSQIGLFVCKNWPAPDQPENRYRGRECARPIRGGGDSSWPMDLGHLNADEQKEYLDRAEFTVFEKVVTESKLGAVLNEKPPRPTALIELPKHYSRRIIPDSIFPHRKHPDTRIARRASTIASLARVISERKVSKGLRQTLLTQARRLEKLAAERLKDFPKEDSDDSND